MSLPVASRKAVTNLLQLAHDQASDPWKPTAQQIHSINSGIFLALGCWLVTPT